MRRHRREYPVFSVASSPLRQGGCHLGTWVNAFRAMRYALGRSTQWKRSNDSSVSPEPASSRVPSNFWTLAVGSRNHGRRPRGCTHQTAGAIEQLILREQRLHRTRDKKPPLALAAGSSVPATADHEHHCRGVASTRFEPTRKKRREGRSGAWRRRDWSLGCRRCAILYGLSGVHGDAAGDFQYAADRRQKAAERS